MAVDFFLKITDVKGESKDTKHAGEIEIESFTPPASAASVQAVYRIDLQTLPTSSKRRSRRFKFRSTESLGCTTTTPGRWTSSTKRSRTAMRSSGVKSTNGSIAAWRRNAAGSRGGSGRRFAGSGAYWIVWKVDWEGAAVTLLRLLGMAAA